MTKLKFKTKTELVKLSWILETLLWLKIRKNKSEIVHPREIRWKWGLLSKEKISRVTKGGKRYSTRLTVAVGNSQSKVGVGIAGGKNFKKARILAIRQAKKKLVRISKTSEKSIPHEIVGQFSQAKVLLRPAPTGEGIKAGKTAKTILILGGIKDVMAKQLGSVNRMHNARATINALLNLKPAKVL